MDKSNGYEDIAVIFIKSRGIAVNGVGASSVCKWAQTLKPASTILDLGCGTGVPVSKNLIDSGMTVYGVDASPSMVQAFKKNFPQSTIACESMEESNFFNRKFDAIISWGLIFLLPESSQELLIQKASKALDAGGKFLFTSTHRKIEWKDAMTNRDSRSLGSEKYKEWLSLSGFSLVGEWEDEGENHYFDALRQ